jgi:aspartyl-tRNA(Asn)/glutamyl-tRNA(Gln) amidotransferase subunit A
MMTIEEFGKRLRARAITSEQATNECLTRIEADNPALNAFILVMADEARAQARALDAEFAAGKDRGPLHGVPVSIKDIFDVRGTATTAASKVREGHVAERDAPAIAHLRQAGAVFVGKTNLHEFAFGTTGDETAFGAIRNPLDLSRSAGGSSSGAAVALVEGMCYGSVGTDTGGSIRIPAAACGVTGLKPTSGEISTEGVVALSATLDHVGPLAGSVTDAALLYYAMLDGDARIDRVPQPAPDPLWLAAPGPYFLDVLDGDVRRLFGAARAALERAGHSIADVAIAHADRIADVYLHIVLPEAAWYHAPMLKEHADKYSPAVRLRLEMGGYLLAEDYLRAMHARTALRRAVDRALEGVDALILPAMAIGAPPLGAASVDVDGRKEPVRAVMLRLTQLFNITGHPAIAIPCGRGADGLPRAIQLVGHRGSTERLIQVALAVERQLRT